MARQKNDEGAKSSRGDVDSPGVLVGVVAGGMVNPGDDGDDVDDVFWSGLPLVVDGRAGVAGTPAGEAVVVAAGAAIGAAVLLVVAGGTTGGGGPTTTLTILDMLLVNEEESDKVEEGPVIVTDTEPLVDGVELRETVNDIERDWLAVSRDLLKENFGRPGPPLSAAGNCTMRTT